MQAVQQRLKAGGRAFAHIAQYHPELTAFRRDLHAHPELGFEEVYTSARVREALRHAGVDEVHEGIGRTGVVAVLTMPALPVDIRHQSKIDRAAIAAWATTVLAGAS